MILPVALLAGGLATRLRPLTEKIPKSLVEVAGEPFISHQLRLLHSRGVERVVVCAGYLGERIQDFVDDGQQFGLSVSYSFDGPVLRGTAGALHQALPQLGDRFLTVYGDSYLPCDYVAACEFFEQSGKLGLMTVFRNEGQWDSSNVEYRDGKIAVYDKKNRTPQMHYIDYGLGAFRREAFDRIPAGEAYDLALLYQNLLAEDQLAGLEVQERFYEIGSFAGIQELTERLNQ